MNMRYWGLYFSQYRELINDDLNVFSVQDLLNFIQEEEIMMHELLSDNESDNDSDNDNDNDYDM